MQNDPFNSPGQIHVFRIGGPGGQSPPGFRARMAALLTAAVTIPVAVVSALFMGAALILSAVLAAVVGLVGSWWLRRRIRGEMERMRRMNPGAGAAPGQGRAGADFGGFSFPGGFTFQVHKGPGAPRPDDEPIEVEIESRR